MLLKNGIVIAIVIVLTSSCGESSTTTPTSDTLTTTGSRGETVPVNTEVVVPEAVKISFNTKYPAVSNVTWSYYEPVEVIDWDWAGWPAMDTTDYVVRYNQDGLEYWTWYDGEEWVGSAATITNYDNLPAAVNKALQSSFAGYTVVSVSKENDKNRTAYELKLTKGDDKLKALIGENGQIYKKKGIVNGEKIKEKNNPKEG